MAKENPGKKNVETKIDIYQAKQDEALDRAKAAMDEGDTNNLVTALFESYALDGLAQRLRNNDRFENLSYDDIDFIIGESVEVLRDYVSKGKKVHYLLGFLWTVANRKAIDILRKRPSQFPVPPDEMEEYYAIAHIEEEERTNYRKKAIRVARSLIPELGGDTIQRVMSFMIEAIEGGFADMTSKEIGDALGLTATTVRKNRERGLKRLRRLFEEKGFPIDVFETEEQE